MLDLVLVEDSPADANLFTMMLQEIGVAHSIKVFSKGEEAINFFKKNKEVPDGIILDLNLCSISGFEVLQWLRNHSRYSNVKVAILTTSERLEDQKEAKANNASFYFKGWDFPTGLKTVQELITTFKG